MNKKKNEENNLKELMSTPRGKAIVFFGAYLIFFLIIAVLARTGGDGSNGANRVYETGGEKQFSLANIENNNYKFNYKIVIDDNYLTYTGVKYNVKEKVTCNSLTEFYGENGNYFTNTSGIWLKTENPYKYSEFYDVENISKLIENSFYVSRTSYESGRTTYNFNLSSATISKLFENIDIDIEEIPNEIVVGTDESNYVNDVKFTLDSYCKAKGICVNNMSITLSYELFGEIEEITSPLE